MENENHQSIGFDEIDRQMKEESDRLFKEVEKSAKPLIEFMNRHYGSNHYIVINEKQVRILYTELYMFFED